MLVNSCFDRGNRRGKEKIWAVRNKARRGCAGHSDIYIYNLSQLLQSIPPPSPTEERGGEEEKEISGGKEGYLYLKWFFWLILPICAEGDRSLRGAQWNWNADVEKGYWLLKGGYVRPLDIYILVHSNWVHSCSQFLRSSKQKGDKRDERWERNSEGERNSGIYISIILALVLSTRKERHMEQKLSLKYVELG